MKTSVKYGVIYLHRNKYTIINMRQFFKVSRSGYYDYVKRMDHPGRGKTLAAVIIQCQEHSRSTYGYRRVQIWLERHGIKRNSKTVLRVMNKYGLLAQIRMPNKYRRMGQRLHKYENILNRNFSADKPNQKWATDISYIHTKQGALYLLMIRDLYDNSIASYETGTEQTVNLVKRTIQKAMEKEVVTGQLQLHSDQGFQYTSTEYHSLTKQYDIAPSMSRRGNCYDNAMAENFFSIPRSECINRLKIETIQQARDLIDDYVYFYNHERSQLKTKQTPLEKRCLFV